MMLQQRSIIWKLGFLHLKHIESWYLAQTIQTTNPENLATRFGQKSSNDETHHYVHLLNSTLTATQRTMCCILENYQKVGSKEKEELVCLYPFTKSSNTTQRKIMQQSDQLVKSHGSKGLTLDQYEMLQTRSNLPIAQLKDDLLHLLEENNKMVISGETCYGKTTQESCSQI